MKNYVWRKHDQQAWHLYVGKRKSPVCGKDVVPAAGSVRESENTAGSGMKRFCIRCIDWAVEHALS